MSRRVSLKLRSRNQDVDKAYVFFYLFFLFFFFYLLLSDTELVRSTEAPTANISTWKSREPLLSFSTKGKRATLKVFRDKFETLNQSNLRISPNFKTRSQWHAELVSNLDHASKIFFLSQKHDFALVNKPLNFSDKLTLLRLGNITIWKDLVFHNLETVLLTNIFNITWQSTIAMNPHFPHSRFAPRIRISCLPSFN